MSTKSKSTKGILIQAAPEFSPSNSDVKNDKYFFAYTITIHNHTKKTCQLLHRQWIIFDSIGELINVNGEGVVGQQPVIMPGQTYSYQSFCMLKSDIGFMQGSYQMKQLENEVLFDVQIPGFELIAPFKLN